MATPYKLNYIEIETGLDSSSTFSHSGDFTANKIIKISGTSNDILLGDGTTTPLSGIASLTAFSATSPLLYNNTTGVFSIPVATSIANGYLSSADWITFNGKQGTITLTTTGTSGAATLIGSTLNIPQYTDVFVGTVTNVSALTLGTTGTDLSSTVANSTTTPVITLNVPTASATNRGALSSTDWTTFNNKQPAGNYITSLTGEATGSGAGAASVTLDNTAVIGKVLTGLNVTGGTVISTDTILAAFGKVQNQVNGLVGGSIFQGTWDASTNTPALASSVGTNGHYYIVSVDGSTNLNGITDWQIGDWAIFAGTTWQKVDNTDSVASVNGYTGTVSLVTGDVLEGAGSLPARPSQLYFTDARARAAISLTTSGSSGASTYDSATGVLNIPNYLQDLSGYVTLNTAQTITAAKTFSTSGNTDTLTISHSSGSGVALTITKGGNGEGLIVNKTGGSGNAVTVTGTLNATTLVKSGGTSSQFLKADGTVDSTAYGTGTIGGSGTTNYIAKFTGTSAIGNSIIQDDGTYVGIGTAPNSSYKLDVNGNTRLNGNLTLGTSGILYIGTANIIEPSGGNLFIGDINNNYGITLLRGGGNNSISLFNNGNVGINTGATDAGYKLDVIGTGRFTGALSGTSATFSGGLTFGVNNRGFIREPAGDVEIGASTGAALKLYSNNVEYAKISPSTGFTTTLAFGGTSATFSSTATASAFIPSGASVPTNGMYLSGTNTLDFATNTTNRLSISSTGAATFTGDVNSNSGFQGRYARIFEASAQRGGLYPYNYILGSGTDYSIGIFSEAEIYLAPGGNATKKFTMASTGAATFSSSVTVSPTNATGVFNINVSSSSYQGTIYFQEAGVAKWEIGKGSGTPDFNIYSYGTASTVMQIKQATGEVYIAGTTDQGAYNLQVNGTGVWGAGAYVNGSDLRLKNSITPLSNSLGLINKLNPVSYKYNEDYSKDQSIQTGFIAQELQEALKDESYLDGIVKEGGTYLSVAYQNIIPLLVKSIQELSAEIKELKGN